MFIKYRQEFVVDSKLSTVYTMISVSSVMAVTSKLYSRSSSAWSRDS